MWIREAGFLGRERQRVDLEGQTKEKAKVLNLLDKYFKLAT